MRGILGWALLAGLAYWVWKNREPLIESGALPQLNLEKPLPEGAVATGEVTETSGGRPGEEWVGWAKRTFAEYVYPTGEKEWIEFKIDQPFRFMPGQSAR